MPVVTYFFSRHPDNEQTIMSRSNGLSTQSPIATRKHKSPQPDLLRILPIGHELRVEALRALLSSLEDMQILSPISDYEDASSTVWRLNRRKEQIDVIVLDWDGSFALNYQLLSRLHAQGQRVLVISSILFSRELREIEAAGASGYCHTQSSLIQLANAIRKVAISSTRCFYLPPEAPFPDLLVKRDAVFCQDRLEARAKEIGWRLNELDRQIISNFAKDTNDEIAILIQRRPGTIRSDLSSRVFLFLQLLSGRSKIPNKKIALQVMLEYGIYEYR